MIWFCKDLFTLTIDTATAQASAPLLWRAGTELAVAGASDGA